jgi:hypothetical protein
MASDIDDTVNAIVSQLKKARNMCTSKPDESLNLTRENLEEFIIKNSGQLVVKSLGIVDDMREIVTATADSRDVTAIADLISATSSVIETLNKVYISDEKNKTQVKVKQMDIDARVRINLADNEVKLLLSREEVMKAFIAENKDVIDV